MKIKEIYEDIIKQRSIDDPQWAYEKIWEIDADLWDSLISKSKSFENVKRPEKYVFGGSADSSGKTVLLEEKYKDIYIYYVLAMDDLLYQDIESYSNHKTLYNALLAEFRADFRQAHRQRSDYFIEY